MDPGGVGPLGNGQRHDSAFARLLPMGVESRRAGQKDRAIDSHRTAAAATAVTLGAWLAEYQSHQAADGAAIYSAVYYLENSGAAEIEIELPERTELQASWLDHQQLSPRNFQVAEGTYRFRLSEDQRYPTLALHYVSRGPALGRATTIRPALPACSFPVHRSRWTLWTPEQFVPDDLVTGYSARRVPWRQRLFGPLARPVGQEVFPRYMLARGPSCGPRRSKDYEHGSWRSDSPTGWPRA